MKSSPRKFNPGLHQDDKSLIEQYVVRLPLLKILLDTIEENFSSPICQHRLYYGPRGRGKTMLLARVAAELRVNPKFSAGWIPVRILEESYYEISTIAEFWLEVMSELTKQLPDHFKKNAELSLQYLKDNWSHPNLQQMAQAAVLEQLNLINKKAVVMLENMHQLIEDSDEDFGWELRRVMQNQPEIMLLATATTRFNNLDNAKQPFFEIFAVSELPPLKRKEAARLWNMLTNTNKTEGEVTPLIILTGGSPRLLTIIAQFGKNNGIRELMENITSLIDEYTEYFKSQLDALAPKERRVFLALADLWSKSTAKEIAERARMDIRSTSSLLGRLEHKGALKVEQLTPGRKAYLVAERLFCIYYKLRRERCQEAVIEALVQFMVDFYTPLEIDTIRSLHSDNKKLSYEELIVLEKLMLTAKEKEISSSEINSIVSTESIDAVNELYKPSVKYHQQGDLNIALVGYEELINRYQDSKEPAIKARVAQAMFNQSVTYGQQDELDKALAGYEELINRYQDSKELAIMVQVAQAMYSQSVTYGQQDEQDKELAGYEELINRYQDSKESAIMVPVAQAMYSQSVTYGQQDEQDKELAGYEELISRYQDSKESAIMVPVAQAMINRSNVLAIKQQWTQSTESYETTLSYLSDNNIPDREVYISTAMLGKDLTEQAKNVSSVQQSSLVKVISAATIKSASEERMTLAIGIGAVFSVDVALSIIQKNSAHEILKPLVIALQLEKGEKERTSEEMLEVAGDVRKRLDMMREEFLH